MQRAKFKVSKLNTNNDASRLENKSTCTVSICSLPRVEDSVCSLDQTKSEWADYGAVQTQCENLSGNELTRNSSGNTKSQSSQLAEPLWTDPGLNRGISARKLISTFK